MTQAALGRPSTILTARINYSGEYLLDQIQSKRVYRPIHGRPAPGVQRGPIVGGDLTAPTKVSHRTGIVSMGNLMLLMHIGTTQWSAMQEGPPRGMITRVWLGPSGSNSLLVSPPRHIVNESNVFCCALALIGRRLATWQSYTHSGSREYPTSRSPEKRQLLQCV